MPTLARPTEGQGHHDPVFLFLTGPLEGLRSAPVATRPFPGPPPGDPPEALLGEVSLFRNTFLVFCLVCFFFSPWPGWWAGRAPRPCLCERALAAACATREEPTPRTQRLGCASPEPSGGSSPPAVSFSPSSAWLLFRRLLLGQFLRDPLWRPRAAHVRVEGRPSQPRFVPPGSKVALMP